MKLLITGGAGFIGSHFVDLVIKKKNVKKILVIDNLEDGSLRNLKSALKSKKVKFVKADIRDFKKIKNLFKNVDKVVHFAALSDVVPSIVEPKLYMDNNINGTINILESMKINKVKKIVYAASSSCYGIPKNFPTNENSPLDPRYPYAMSKLICEDIIEHWSKVYGFSFLSLRLFNVYGTRSRTNSAYGAALGVFLKQKILNKPFTIVGNGNQTRDFIYVSDVCNAFYKALNKKLSNQKFNIGYGKPRKVNEMVKIIGGPKIFVPKRPGEPDCTHADISKAKKLLSWKPKVTLEKGLNIVIKNISYWKDAPLWTPKKIKLATKDWFKYIKK
tara:strand:- start:3098 stop:4090 length:993 start_codon:yes stop_codon:yes gene_type:complete